MSPFGLFRKKKEEPQSEQQPQEKPQEEQQQVEKPAPAEETAIEEQPVAEEQPAPEAPPTEALPPVSPPAITTPEKTTEEPKTYLKAMPLRELADLENVKKEVSNGNIVILRITPLASKSIEDVKQAVDQLYSFAESINGDIARLGEERVVICPKTVRIWREKTPAQNAPLPTAA